jgi:hypothetical protein
VGKRTGPKFLLNLLKKDLGAEITADESQSAMELSDGHALAISQMAGLIHRRSWSIKEFLATPYSVFTTGIPNGSMALHWVPRLMLFGICHSRRLIT